MLLALAAPAQAYRPPPGQTSFNALLQDGFEIRSVTPVASVARDSTVPGFVITLQKGASVAVCAFETMAWIHMKDEALASFVGCEVRPPAQ